jgi:hypothetical protein
VDHDRLVAITEIALAIRSVLGLESHAPFLKKPNFVVCGLLTQLGRNVNLSACLECVIAAITSSSLRLSTRLFRRNNSVSSASEPRS